jgi:DNA-binding MarR family transcriptional regulator
MGDDLTAIEFIELLYRVNRTIVDDARAHVAAVADLDVSEFMVLRVAAQGDVSPRDLAQRLSTHPTATSRTITTLVKAGLLHRVSDPGDARRLVIKLTDEGRRITNLIGQRIRPELQRRFDRVGTDRVQGMLETLAALLPD